MGMIVNSSLFGVAAGYVETGEIGNHVASSGTYNIGGNFKSVISVTVPVGGIWVKKFYIRMYSSALNDKITPILYNGVISTSALVKAGQEYVNPSGFTNVETETTSNWNSDGSAYFIPAGSYGLGLIAQGSPFCRSVVDGQSTYWNGDTYSDGPTSTYGSPSTSANHMIAWCPYSVTGP